ncbi:TetR/AcrR family transcriptional regulator [Heyndrickxia coagulans]|uniref:TetR/AcrR family transcriptional regulator n=1 Tax=Heyndrickxia coagulans TaxID=1398 RepID=UPI003D1A381A
MAKSKREAIIQAAKKLFQVQGYHATGINQIIEESGAPKGSLYYHFPNGKEEIAIAAIDSVKVEVRQELEQLLAGCDDPIEAMQAQLLHVAEKVFGDQPDFRIGLLASESANLNENIREACKNAYEEWIATDTDYLMKKGYTKESARQTAVLFHILIEGAMTMSITYKDASYFQLVAEQIPKIVKNI